MSRLIVSYISISNGIFLLLALALPIFIFIFLRRQEEFIDITLRITDDDVLYANTIPASSYVNSFAVGDEEKNELGQVVAKITTVESFPVSPDVSLTFLHIQVKSLFNPRKNLYMLKGKPIVYGESFQFTFENSKVKGLITDYPGYSGKKGREKKIIAHSQLRYDSRNFSDVYGVPQFLDEAINVGDSVYDSSGKQIIRILEKKSVPAKRTTIDRNGNAVVVSDPLLKDISFTLELNVQEIDYQYYLYGILPVKIDQSIPINLQQVSIFPVITSFEEQK